MLVSSLFIGLIEFGHIGSVSAPYISHNPFRINNNKEFASMAGVEGKSGKELLDEIVLAAIKMYDLK
jgi:hypothetical protein